MASLSRHSTTPALFQSSAAATVQPPRAAQARFRPRRSSTRRPRGRRDSSVGSLDRVFDTRSTSPPPHGRWPAKPAAAPAPAPAASRTTATATGCDIAVGSYGISEVRDSFFDAVFVPPSHISGDPDNDEEAERLLWARAEATLPYAFRKKDPLSLRGFLPAQYDAVSDVVWRVATTRAGIKLLKSFLAVFAAYALCLAGPVRRFLGRYGYVMVLSTILNHPGRTLGAQVDGAVQTVVGTATGLGWGAFGLWLSTATATARVGYGGILAMFLFLYIFTIACLRAYYIRTYQGVICAGIAISYTCLAEVSATDVSWGKLRDFIVPWVIGQGISLLFCAIVAPDAGARPLAVALHNAFGVLVESLAVSCNDSRSRRRKLAQTFANMSQAYRDMVLDFSITRFSPADVLALRNLIQGVVRALLSLETHTRLFDSFMTVEPAPGEFVVSVDECAKGPENAQERELLEFVAGNLADPTKDLMSVMKESLKRCDALLMEMCGHRHHLGPDESQSNDVPGSLVKLRKKIQMFSNAQDSVLASKRLPPTYGDFPEVVKLFAFCRPIHQAATAVDALLVKVNEMQQRRPTYPQFHPPSYPFWKALHRTNAQVRHDRGGVTAGSYFKSFSDIAEMIQKIKSRDFQPLPRKSVSAPDDSSGAAAASLATMTAAEPADNAESKQTRIRYDIWSFLHRLQGFETKFGLKAAAVTSLLSVPAWLGDTTTWWNEYEIWWAVTMAWLIMGPRTGGNIQDLFTRALCGVLGAVWGGLSYAAGNGNPYVTAVFCVIYMVPMVYRYTQSNHPRSGLVGCISFTVVSLAAQTGQGDHSAAVVAATRGAAIVLGVVASIIVNWILWPFVARHDLRKATSTMMFYCSIIYRSIVSKYVYYEAGHAPTKEDITGSEILEGRLREGFVRLRQLMGLTRHELRMRAPFDPVAYSALIDACERFFEYVVALRQSSLFYHPHFIHDNPDAAADLLGVRRDAIATILTNLYVLSGALRADRHVPKYLPSAAITRQQLLARMRQLETEIAAREEKQQQQKKAAASNADQEKRYEAGSSSSSLIDDSDASKQQQQQQQQAKATPATVSEAKKWTQIYSYSYNESLTGCVEQLEELERYTKVIVGEQGFDIGFTDEDVGGGGINE